MGLMSSIFQASGDKTMKPTAYNNFFILVLQVIFIRFLELLEVLKIYFSLKRIHDIKGQIFQNYIIPEIHEIKIRKKYR